MNPESRNNQEHGPARHAYGNGRHSNLRARTEGRRERDGLELQLERSAQALRHVQVELQAAVTRQAELLDALPVPYVTLSGTGEILAANRAAAEWLQRDASAIVGSNFSRWVDSRDRSRVAAQFDECRRKAAILKIETTLRLPNGGTRAVEVACRRDAASADGKLHLAITDISAFTESQKVLDDFNREQEILDYSISHDLRAPLITITNYARIVLSEFAGNLNPEGRNMIERIQCAAQRMETTLQHLLEYSTLGREDITLQRVSTEAVITELLIRHHAAIEARDAAITVEPPLPDLLGSETVLRRVLANLLTNALKYTEPDVPPRIVISAETRPHTIVLKIRDAGIGIESRYHEKIFQLFERLHGYSRYPGSGVGLAIARRAVERMNGKIWVESEPGRGSCFCLELPRP